jgi:hypothetical protein
MVSKFVHDDASAAVPHFAEFMGTKQYGTAPPEVDLPTGKRKNSS